MITDCVIRNVPNTIMNREQARILRNSTGLKLRMRGRGARNRFEHQELPLFEAPRFSAYYQGENASGGHGDCTRRIYFDWLGTRSLKPHLKLGAKTW
jgi:hypothetical protein